MSRMKYVKLFEEFSTDKYELIIKFPDVAVCQCEDEEEATFLREYLESQGYVRKNQSTITHNHLTLTWRSWGDGKQYWQIQDAASKFVIDPKLNFDDIFKFKYESRGHKLKKKFRI